MNVSSVRWQDFDFTAHRQHDDYDLPRAYVRGNVSVLIPGFIVLVALAAWGSFRILQHFSDIKLPLWWPVFALSSVLFIIQQSLAYADYIRGGKRDTYHNVAVLVPLYNEDPNLVFRSLKSMLRQTRLPDSIHVTDDGSSAPGIDYSELRSWFMAECKRLGVTGSWVAVKNAGKRHAQSVGVKASPEATIYATVDSDSVLDRHAIEEGLKPFRRRYVTAVAATVMALKPTANLLSRVTDVLFVSHQQLSDRSALSAVGSVLVNSGGLAFYRAQVIRDNMGAYLSETFMGKPVTFSDDSMLTLYALQYGNTVQQRSSVVFCAMPEEMKHHLKQQMRWFRGSFIRSLWRIKYLPRFSWGFARQIVGWVQFVLTSIALVWLVSTYVVHPHLFSWEVIVVPLLMSYAQGLRYLTFSRSDVSRTQQVANYLLMPLAWLWQTTVLRYLRIYAACTCAKTGWNTRQKVEVFDDVLTPADDTSADASALSVPTDPESTVRIGSHAAVAEPSVVDGIRRLSVEDTTRIQVIRPPRHALRIDRKRTRV